MTGQDLFGQTHRRADLQGMRALAVLAVVFYHYGLSWLPGGFVGVDIFFVLSGFFIIRLLNREVVETGRVDLLAFWARRAKRLLPNALLTLIVVVLASAILLPGYRLKLISQDAIAAAGFFANLHFEQRAIDYFHLGDPPSPLLHFWSLAVEEQFYFVMPVLMALVGWLLPKRRGAAVAWMLAALALASLVAALAVIADSQPKAFFQPQYRAWQLLLGGLVTLSYPHRARLVAWLRGALCWLGLAAILASLLTFSDDLTYPGVFALLPTLGAALMLLGLDAGAAAPLSRLLASRPATVIGDMSYSLYLWHWPVLIFSQALFPQDVVVRIATGIVALLLSALAYYGVERPIHRLSPRQFRALPLLGGAAAGIAVVVGASLAVAALPGPTSPEIAAKIEQAQKDLGLNYEAGCHLDYAVVAQPDCRFGAVSGKRRVVLFGDSHAAQWFTPLDIAARQAGWQLQAITKTSCPVADVTIWYPPLKAPYRECDQWRAEQMAALVANPPDLIVMVSYAHYNGWLYDADRNAAAGRRAEPALWEAGVAHTLEKLRATGSRLVWLADTPEMYAGYLDCLSAGDWVNCSRPRAEALGGLQPSPEMLKGVEILDLSETLCEPADCFAAKGDQILYRDQNHLTATYAASLSDRFLALLR